MDPETRSLDPRVLPLAPEARALLVRFADAIEVQQAPGRQLAQLTGSASKAAEQAARIAGVLTLWRDLGAPHVTAMDIADGIALAQYYLTEAARRMPVTHRRALRTTNLLERLFVEERRRLKIIPNAFGERPVLKLMFGAMTRAAERWRSIRFTEFERRQIEAVREEIHAEYETFDTTSSDARQARTVTGISSNSRT